MDINRKSKAAALTVAIAAIGFTQTAKSDAEILVTPNITCVDGPCTKPTIKPSYQPTTAPTATPVPSPRKPTSTDVSQLTALIGRSSATVTSIAIVGNFAEACWSSGNVGGAITATNTSGSWTQLSATKGGYTTGDLASLSSTIPSNIASQLVTQAAKNNI